MIPKYYNIEFIYYMRHLTLNELKIIKMEVEKEINKRNKL